MYEKSIIVLTRRHREVLNPANLSVLNKVAVACYSVMPLLTRSALRGFNPQANYADRAIAAGQRS
jgi:hypothetical protein